MFRTKDVLDSASDNDLPQDDDKSHEEVPVADEKTLRIEPSTEKQDREDALKRRQDVDGALKEGGRSAWTDAWPIKWGPDKGVC